MRHTAIMLISYPEKPANTTESRGICAHRPHSLYAQLCPADTSWHQGTAWGLLRVYRDREASQTSPNKKWGLQNEEINSPLPLPTQPRVGNSQYQLFPFQALSLTLLLKSPLGKVPVVMRSYEQPVPCSSPHTAEGSCPAGGLLPPTASLHTPWAALRAG